MAYSKIAAFVAVLGLSLSACSGMGGNSMTPSAPSAPSQVDDAQPAQADDATPPAGHAVESPSASTQPAAQAAAGQAQSPALPAGRGKGTGNANAISAVNALGGPLKTYSDENSNEPGSNLKSKADIKPSPSRKGKGVCHAGIEFFVPDKAEDPNSTETQDFFDRACTQLARDVVRKWTTGSQPGTETVARTVTEYAQGSATAIAVKNDSTAFANATFSKNGFPVVANGFQRETAGQLTIGTAKDVLSDTETVMAASTSNVNNYCTDSAGYNTIGSAKLNLSFGWQGGDFTGGTRTANTDGSVTWNATHAGQTESAALGALSITTNAPNTACPIVNPAYTLVGGTTKGTYSLPITVTYLHGVIRSLTVTNGSLSSGDTLNVKTNTSKWPANSGFINGTVTNGSTTIAIFNVNAFGNGTLTVASTGNQFTISDWNVVR
jgi:hypothetical protein